MLMLPQAHKTRRDSLAWAPYQANGRRLNREVEERVQSTAIDSLARAPSEADHRRMETSHKPRPRHGRKGVHLMTRKMRMRGVKGLEHLVLARAQRKALMTSICCLQTGTRRDRSCRQPSTQTARQHMCTRASADSKCRSLTCKCNNRQSSMRT